MLGIGEDADLRRRGRLRALRSSTSLVSPPCAPAFIRSAPPIEPGMPRRNASPSMPASAAALATRASSAAAPATQAMIRPRRRSRRTPCRRAGSRRRATPPSRTIRLEPRPMTVTGTSARQRAQEIGEVVFVGRREQRFGRAADAEPGEGRERLIRRRAARATPALARDSRSRARRNARSRRQLRRASSDRSARPAAARAGPSARVGANCARIDARLAEFDRVADQPGLRSRPGRPRRGTAAPAPSRRGETPDSGRAAWRRAARRPAAGRKRRRANAARCTPSSAASGEARPASVSSTGA